MGADDEKSCPKCGKDVETQGLSIHSKDDGVYVFHRACWVCGILYEERVNGTGEMEVMWEGYFP